MAITFCWGNIAAATCDTWSNESVQNVKLLGGMAPTVALEQLIYDTRLMNQASEDGRDAALLYQRWMVNSDARLDPQAYILTPENAIAVAHAIVSAPNEYLASQQAALTAIKLLRQGIKTGKLKIPERELPWLDRMQRDLESLPSTETEFIREMMGQVDTTKFRADDYFP